MFINCPFDDAYRPLFRAVVFAIHDCGFFARSALEVSDSGEVRIQKILRIIDECALGIHDIYGSEIARRYAVFVSELTSICAAFELKAGKPTFKNYVQVVVRWLKLNPR